MQQFVVSILFAQVPAIVPITIGLIAVCIYCYAHGVVKAITLNNNRLGGKF